MAPLAAVPVLHASTLLVGLLTTAGFAAFLLIGLPVSFAFCRSKL